MSHGVLPQPDILVWGLFPRQQHTQLIFPILGQQPPKSCLYIHGMGLYWVFLMCLGWVLHFCLFVLYFSSLQIWSCRMMRTFCCFSDGKLPWTTAWNSCGSVSLCCLFPSHTNSFFNTYISTICRTQYGKYMGIVAAKHVLTCSGREGCTLFTPAKQRSSS